MDTSETYVKMCEKAGEIQHETPKSIYIGSKPGSFFYSKYLSKIVVAEYAQNPETVIWLPRQDQLQEMVEWDFVGFTKTGEMEIYKNREQINFLKGSSFEQLWLAFVMKEKHGKVWNGEDWVKEGK